MPILWRVRVGSLLGRAVPKLTWSQRASSVGCLAAMALSCAPEPVCACTLHFVAIVGLAILCGILSLAVLAQAIAALRATVAEPAPSQAAAPAVPVTMAAEVGADAEQNVGGISYPVELSSDDEESCAGGSPACLTAPTGMRTDPACHNAFNRNSDWLRERLRAMPEGARRRSAARANSTPLHF